MPGVQRAVDAIRNAGLNDDQKSPMVTTLLQNSKQTPTLVAQVEGGSGANQGETTAVIPAPGEESTKRGAGEIGQLGPVQVEVLEGLDALIVRGHKRDVEQVMKVIKQIEEISAQTVPAIEVYRLKYIDCQALADLIKPLYEEIYTPRQGNVSITALVKPNALLLVGRKENVKTVLELAERLDEPVPPQTQFHVFRLRHTAAGTALNTLTDFYTDRGGLGAR